MDNPIARLALPTLALVLVLVPSDVDAQYRNLCTSIPSQCTYTGPNVPKLDANVCYGRTTGIRLMSSGSCPTNMWPYYVDYGEVVDPITNAVAAYIPLDNACGHPGICEVGPPPPDAQEMPMCCIDNVCTHAIADCNGNGGILYFCEDGVCNDDGTVTCFAAEPL